MEKVTVLYPEEREAVATLIKAETTEAQVKARSKYGVIYQRLVNRILNQ